MSKITINVLTSRVRYIPEVINNVTRVKPNGHEYVSKDKVVGIQVESSIITEILPVLNSNLTLVKTKDCEFFSTSTRTEILAQILC